MSNIRIAEYGKEGLYDWLLWRRMLRRLTLQAAPDDGSAASIRR